MPPAQLKETTMNPDSRRLLQVSLPKRDMDGADDRRDVDKLVTTLMGKKPELRFNYIRDHAYEVMQVGCIDRTGTGQHRPAALSIKLCIAARQASGASITGQMPVPQAVTQITIGNNSAISIDKLGGVNSSISPQTTKKD